MKPPFFFFFALFITTNCFGQFSMGVAFNNVSTKTYSSTIGASFDKNQSYERGITLSYLFPRNKKNQNAAYGIAANFMSYQRLTKESGKEIFIDYVSIPLCVELHLPRNRNEDDKFPIFDAILSFGYQIAVPTSSNYLDNELYTDFYNHGFVSNLALAFYTNRGAKFQFGLWNSLDLVAKNKKIASTVVPPKFIAQGISFVFSAPLTKETLKEAFGKKKKK
jgi:hypothetical protein